MSEVLKLTFTGGDEIGDVVEREFTSPIVIGRSRSADIHVHEPDVSGRHLELVRRDGMCFAKNLSRFAAKIDGQTISTGEEAAFHGKSLIEIGSHLRIRVDKLPGGEGDIEVRGTQVDDTPTAATNFAEDGVTGATVFQADSTFATVAGDAPADLSHISMGSVEESATKDVLSIFEQSAAPLESGVRVSCAETIPPQLGDSADSDDSVTADDPQETFLEGMKNDGDATSTGAVGFDEMAASTGSIAGDESTGGGETQEMLTRVGSMEEILERRRQLDRATAAGHWRFGICIVLSLAALGAAWFATMNRRHLDDAEGPFLPDGAKDIAEYDITDSAGANELFLECPRDDRMTIVYSADSNEQEVVSFIGQDRDVPFRQWFCRVKDPSELKLSLEESFSRWMEKMTRARGFVFERTRGGNPLAIEFFDVEFDGYCEYQTGCGIPFMRADYTHTVERDIWRGVCYRFRCGDLVYSVCNEIPEQFWRRGASRLRKSPFFGMYAGFIDRQWDSPGEDGLIKGLDDAKLVTLIRNDLAADRPRNWPTIEMWIDTLLVSTWGQQTIDAKSALELRDELLRHKSKFYDSKRFAYETALTDGSDKRMKSIFSDVLEVFGVSKRDRRYYLVNNPEEWKCQLEQ